MDMMFIDYLARFGHVLFGVTWIGLFITSTSFKQSISKKPNRLLGLMRLQTSTPCAGGFGGAMFTF